MDFLRRHRLLLGLTAACVVSALVLGGLVLLGRPRRADHTAGSRLGGLDGVAPTTTSTSAGAASAAGSVTAPTDGSGGGDRSSTASRAMGHVGPDSLAVSASKTELDLVQPDGPGRLRLTGATYVEAGSTKWAPGRQSIGYIDGGDLYVVGLNGRRIGPVRIKNDPVTRYWWSTDSSMLAVRSRLGVAIVAVAAPRDTVVGPVPLDIAPDSDVAWAIDNHAIAFDSAADHKVHVLTVQGGQSVIRNKVEDFPIGWDATGAVILRDKGAYAEGDTSQRSWVWRADASGHDDPTLLEVTNCWDPPRYSRHAGSCAALSPDGQRLAFRESYYEGSPTVVELTSGERTKVPTPFGELLWAPNSHDLLVSTQTQTYVVHADGSGARKVMDMAMAETNWSPDSGRIAWDTYPGGGQPGVRTIDVRTLRTSVTATPYMTSWNWT